MTVLPSSAKITTPRGLEHAPSLVRYGRMVLIMSAVAAVGMLLRALLNPTDLAMLVLVGVVLVATYDGRGPAVAASVLGLAGYDFLFVPPYYTFDVTDKSYFVTFGVMLVVALSLTRLTAQIRDQAEEAEERARRSEALVGLIRQLADAPDRSAIITAAERQISHATEGHATIVPTDGMTMDDGVPRWPAGGAFEDLSVRVASTWAWQHGEPAGSGTRHAAEAEGLVVPLRSLTRTLGVVVLQPVPSDRRVTTGERATVQELADQTALALELSARTAVPR